MTIALSTNRNVKSRMSLREAPRVTLPALRAAQPHYRVMKSLRKRARLVADQPIEAEIEQEVSRLLKELNTELRLLNEEIASFNW